MITIHVLEMNVNYFMYIIGYNFLFLCTIVSQQQIIMILIEFKGGEITLT